MKKRIAKHFFVFFLFVFLFFSAGSVVRAASDILGMQEGLTEIGKTTYGTTGAPKDIRVIVALLIRKLIGFLGIILTVLFMYSGFQWMNAGGDKAKVDTAKTRIKNAIIGLIIILSAYILTDFIIGCALSVTGDATFTFGGVCK